MIEPFDVYLDASVLVAAFTDDPLTARAEAVLPTNPNRAIVSDFAGAEFASGVARKARTGELSREAASAAFLAFDRWVSTACLQEAITSADVQTATGIIRSLDLTLRAPDALHLAASRRLGSRLATFDARLSACAIRLGIDLAG